MKMDVRKIGKVVSPETEIDQMEKGEKKRVFVENLGAPTKWLVRCPHCGGFFTTTVDAGTINCANCSNPVEVA